LSLVSLCLFMLIFIRPKLSFLPLYYSQWFHRQVAYSLLVYTIAHVCAHYVK
jgi:NADPH oxidase